MPVSVESQRLATAAAVPPLEPAGTVIRLRVMPAIDSRSRGAERPLNMLDFLRGAGFAKLLHLIGIVGRR